MRIDKQGGQSLCTFDTGKLFPRMYAPWRNFEFQGTTTSAATGAKDTYLDDLKAVAMFYGLYPEDIDALIEDGLDPTEIEEMLYCGAY